MRTRWSWYRRLFMIVLPLALAACGGTQMNTVGEAPAIRQGESMMVFMRASQLGGLVSASVFDVTSSETKFVGLVNYGTKLAHPLKPGQYTFMVVGESADFMQATVLPGRTYYALVTPRIGVWKARFSFRPVRQGELEGAEFAGWDKATPQYVANSAESLNWAQQNAADVESKRSQYWSEWTAKPEDQRASQTLAGEDGKPTTTAAAAAPTAIAASASAAAPMSTATRVETVFWESIRNSSDPADFRAYLEQYPNGAYAPIARNRLNALAPAAAPQGAALAVPAARSAPRPGLPVAGDTWTYRVVEPNRGQSTYVATVTGASENTVTERFSTGQGPDGSWTHKGEPALVPVGKQVLAPYLLAFTNLPAGRMAPRNLPIQDPACTGTYFCEAIGTVIAWEKVKVPAGTFDAIKVEIRQNWRAGQNTSGQFAAQQQGGRILHVWYSRETKRAVKFVSRTTFGSLPPIDPDFEMELVSYKLQ